MIWVLRHMQALRLWSTLVLAACLVFCAASDRLQAAPGDAFIIVANKAYRSGVPSVEFADRDADAIEKAAGDPRVLNIPRTGIARFNDMTQGDANAWFQRDGTPGRELTDHLRRAAAGRPDGTIYFYYSGHGISARNTERGNDELHFVLQDTRTNAIGATALSITTVQLALNVAQREFMPQGRVVLLIDACFSGVDRNNEPLWQGSRLIGADTKVKALARDRMVTLGASAANEPAWSDATRRHGAFTDALLDGLYGRAALTDGRITGESLHQFVSARVSERLARANRTQTPTLDGDTTTAIALLNTPFPERDPHLAARLVRQCAIVRESSDVTEVDSFLKTSCQDDCPCRAELALRLQVESACIGEAADLDDLIRKGERARAQIVALQGHLACPSVKARSSATLDTWDMRAAAAMAREVEEGKAAREREARAAERTAAETEVRRKPAADDTARARTAIASAPAVAEPSTTPAPKVAMDTVRLFDARAVPSFSCLEYARKPPDERTPQSDILCIHVEAAAADTRMGTTFRTYRDRFDAQTKRVVLDRQTQWIAERNLRCPATWTDVADDKRRAEIAACLLGVTRARQAELAAWAK